jgi:chromate reductase
MPPHERTINVLGIAGSLRKASFNRRLLEIARDVAPPSLNLGISNLVGRIPLFCEDLEGPEHKPPAPVRALRAEIESADAILIATPEYNQSMPGVLKNAIDWLSRPAPESAFEGKLVALCGITTGEWGTRLSQAAIRQTLFAAGARLLPLHLYLRKAEGLLVEGQPADESIGLQLAGYMADLSRQLTPTAAG